MQTLYLESPRHWTLRGINIGAAWRMGNSWGRPIPNGNPQTHQYTPSPNGRLILGFPLCIASINIPNGCFLSHGGTPVLIHFKNGCLMKSTIYFGVPPFVETRKYFRGFATSNIFRSSGFWLLGSMGNPLYTSRGMLMGISLGFLQYGYIPMDYRIYYEMIGII